MEIDILNKEKSEYKSNPKLRVGLSYVNGNSLNNYYNTTDRKPYDTLTSSQTGSTILIDSVNSKSYYMDYNFEQIRLDASLIFSTNQKSRWSVYTGFGISAGLSLNSNSNISYYESKGIETNDQRIGIPSLNNNNFQNSERETFRNKINFGIMAYVPIGIDFRIAKKNEFWKRAHLFYELRPGINFTSIPELRTIGSASLQSGFGVKFGF